MHGRHDLPPHHGRPPGDLAAPPSSQQAPRRPSYGAPPGLPPAAAHAHTVPKPGAPWAPHHAAPQQPQPRWPPHHHDRSMPPAAHPHPGVGPPPGYRVAARVHGPERPPQRAPVPGGVPPHVAAVHYRGGHLPPGQAPPEQPRPGGPPPPVRAALPLRALPPGAGGGLSPHPHPGEGHHGPPHPHGGPPPGMGMDRWRQGHGPPQQPPFQQPVRLTAVNDLPPGLWGTRNPHVPPPRPAGDWHQHHQAAAAAPAGQPARHAHPPPPQHPQHPQQHPQHPAAPMHPLPSQPMGFQGAAPSQPAASSRAPPPPAQPSSSEHRSEPGRYMDDPGAAGHDSPTSAMANSRMRRRRHVYRRHRGEAPISRSMLDAPPGALGSPAGEADADHGPGPAPGDRSSPSPRRRYSGAPELPRPVGLDAQRGRSLEAGDPGAAQAQQARVRRRSYSSEFSYSSYSLSPQRLPYGDYAQEPREPAPLRHLRDDPMWQQRRLPPHDSGGLDSDSCASSGSLSSSPAPAPRLPEPQRQLQEEASPLLSFSTKTPAQSRRPRGGDDEALSDIDALSPAALPGGSLGGSGLGTGAAGQEDDMASPSRPRHDDLASAAKGTSGGGGKTTEQEQTPNTAVVTDPYMMLAEGEVDAGGKVSGKSSLSKKQKKPRKGKKRPPGANRALDFDDGDFAADAAGPDEARSRSRAPLGGGGAEDVGAIGEGRRRSGASASSPDRRQAGGHGGDRRFSRGVVDGANPPYAEASAGGWTSSGSMQRRSRSRDLGARRRQQMEERGERGERNFRGSLRSPSPGTADPPRERSRRSERSTAQDRAAFHSDGPPLHNEADLGLEDAVDRLLFDAQRACSSLIDGKRGTADGRKNADLPPLQRRRKVASPRPEEEESWERSRRPSLPSPRTWEPARKGPKSDSLAAEIEEVVRVYLRESHLAEPIDDVEDRIMEGRSQLFRIQGGLTTAQELLCHRLLESADRAQPAGGQVRPRPKRRFYATDFAQGGQPGRRGDRPPRRRSEARARRRPRSRGRSGGGSPSPCSSRSLIGIRPPQSGRQHDRSRSPAPDFGSYSRRPRG
eukprot:TRINITY_DN31990_c0_g2_i3.p1 TRINITY_DN31990_c0_g2~~TRINITY_DN31990_c0_g2_i3.p1  ORF type:complete len:1070 (-),score=168.04 TRINITY_DN31990_c0_g2_i3:131-3340(-)